jgi:GMP synthase-like glutamine amidotransferase
LTVFHLHSETVQNKKAKLLGSGPHCRNQILRITGNSWGIQGHLEMDHAMLARWLEEDPELSKVNKDAAISHYRRIEDEYQDNARGICSNFLKAAGLL